MKGDKLTFEELVEQVLISIIRTSASTERIDVVFDVYWQLFIKGADRAMQGSETGICFTNINSWSQDLAMERSPVLQC